MFAGLAEQGEAVQLTKNAGLETSNDQQTLPLLGKKALVVDGGQALRRSETGRTPFGHRGRRVSGIRSEPQASRSQVLWICQGAPRGARVARFAAKRPIRLTSVSCPVARQGRSGRRLGRRRRGRTRRQAEALVI